MSDFVALLPGAGQALGGINKVINKPVSNLITAPTAPAVATAPAAKPGLPLPSQTSGDVIAPADASPNFAMVNKDPNKPLLPIYGTADNASLTPQAQETPDQMSKRKGFWDTLVSKRDALKSQGLTMYDFPSSQATDEQLNTLVKQNPKLWREYVLGQGGPNQPYRFDIGTVQPKAPEIHEDVQSGGNIEAPPESFEEPKPAPAKAAPAGESDILKWLKGAGLGIVDLLQAAAAGSTAGSQRRALDWAGETTIGANEKKKADEAANQLAQTQEEAKFNRGAEFQKQLAVLQAQLQAKAQAVDAEFKEKWQAAQTQAEKDALVQKHKFDLENIWASAAAQKQAALPGLDVSSDSLGVRNLQAPAPSPAPGTKK